MATATYAAAQGPSPPPTPLPRRQPTLQPPRQAPAARRPRRHPTSRARLAGSRAAPAPSSTATATSVAPPLQQLLVNRPPMIKRRYRRALQRRQLLPGPAACGPPPSARSGSPTTALRSPNGYGRDLNGSARHDSVRGSPVFLRHR